MWGGVVVGGFGGGGIISKEAFGNSWDILFANLCHRYISESSQQGHTKQINPKFATESEFYHICVLKCVSCSSVETFDLDLVSE